MWFWANTYVEAIVPCLELRPVVFLGYTPIVRLMLWLKRTRAPFQHVWSYVLWHRAMLVFYNIGMQFRCASWFIILNRSLVLYLFLWQIVSIGPCGMSFSLCVALVLTLHFWSCWLPQYNLFVIVGTHWKMIWHHFNELSVHVHVCCNLPICAPLPCHRLQYILWHVLARVGSTWTALSFRILLAILVFDVSCAFVWLIYLYLTLVFWQHVHGWEWNSHVFVCTRWPVSVHAVDLKFGFFKS